MFQIGLFFGDLGGTRCSTAFASCVARVAGTDGFVIEETGRYAVNRAFERERDIYIYIYTHVYVHIVFGGNFGKRCKLFFSFFTFGPFSKVLSDF